MSAYGTDRSTDGTAGCPWLEQDRKTFAHSECYRFWPGPGLAGPCRGDYLHGSPSQHNSTAGTLVSISPLGGSCAGGKTTASMGRDEPLTDAHQTAYRERTNFRDRNL